MRTATLLLGAAAFAVNAAACGGTGDDDSTPSAVCTVETIAEALTPGYSSVAAVFGFSYEEIYMVGSKFHRYGVTAGWQEIDGIEDAYYADIWGSSPSDIFLVGAPGIHHYDGSKVEAMEHPQLDEVTVVWGTSSSNVYALGYIYAESHNLLRYDGHEWTMEHTFGEDGPEGCWFEAMWGTGEDDIWAGGDQCLLHFDGSEWTKMDLESWGAVSGIWGAAPDDIWLVGRSAAEGNNTLIMHWDGTSLEKVMDKYPYYDDESSMASSYALLDIWGYGPNSIYSVGKCAAYFDGTGWTIIPKTGGIGVYGEDPTNTLMINGYGTVRRLNCQ